MAKKTENTLSIDITTATIVKVAAAILGIWLFFKVWEIMASLFLGFVLAAAIEPTISWLEKQKIKRIISVPAIYILSVAALFGSFYIFLPTLFQDVFLISQTFPQQYGNFLDSLFQLSAFDNLGFLAPALDELLLNLQNRIAEIIPNLFGFISTLFGGIASFGFILVFSFYLLLRRKDLENSLVSVTPDKYKDDAKLILRAVQRRIGRWLQAIFVLATFVGVTTFVILSLLGVKFALTLGIVAGIFEIVPYIGPFIAGALIFLAGSSEAFSIGLIALLAFILLQQIEQAVVVPAVMSRVVGFNPLFIIIFVLIGATLAGIWGIIVAVPLAAAISEVVRGINRSKERAKKK
ncbi:MAG: AI-2E family transporter [Candidatus Spechtbacterales bacterium]|nr:AI-2E family transporter [Candidatus Spechtbacterales bacterium]